MLVFVNRGELCKCGVFSRELCRFAKPFAAKGGRVLAAGRRLPEPRIRRRLAARQSPAARRVRALCKNRGRNAAGACGALIPRRRAAHMPPASFLQNFFDIRAAS